MGMNVDLPVLDCMRCGYHWTPRQREIHLCPRCKSVHWETKRTNRRGLRPQPSNKGRTK